MSAINLNILRARFQTGDGLSNKDFIDLIDTLLAGGNVGGGEVGGGGGGKVGDTLGGADGAAQPAKNTITMNTPPSLGRILRLLIL